MKRLKLALMAYRLETSPSSTIFRKLWRFFSQLFFFNLFFSGRVSRSGDWKDEEMSDDAIAAMVKSGDAVFIELPVIQEFEDNELVSQEIDIATKPPGWMNINIITWMDTVILQPSDPAIKWHLWFKAIDDFTMCSTITKRCSILLNGPAMALIGDGHVVFFATNEEGELIPLTLVKRTKRIFSKITSVPLV